MIKSQAFILVFSCHGLTFYLFYLFSFVTRAGSPQQREPIAVGPYYLTPPPCQLSLWEETGVPGENPRLSAERSLYSFSHEDWVRVHIKVNLTAWGSNSERGDHYTTEAHVSRVGEWIKVYAVRVCLFLIILSACLFNIIHCTEVQNYSAFEQDIQNFSFTSANNKVLCWAGAKLER